MEALLSHRLILFITSVSTVSFLTLSPTGKELLNNNKLISSSQIFDPRSCVIKMINYAGSNISLSSPVRLMTLNVGKKNILNSLVVSMTHNVGDNFFQPYLATSRILNVGGNLDIIHKEQPLTRPLKNFRIQKDSWTKKKESLVKSLTKLRILLVERLNKLNNLREIQLNKQNTEHKEQNKQHRLPLAQRLQVQNHLFPTRPKQSRIEWSMESNTLRTKLLMLKI